MYIHEEGSEVDSTKKFAQAITNTPGTKYLKIETLSKEMKDLNYKMDITELKTTVTEIF